MERAPQTLVVDASVVVRWFVPEEDSDRALRLRNRYVEGGLELFAPDLMIYEVINTLRYHRSISDKMLREDTEALFAIDIDFISPSSEMVALTAGSARRWDLSLYDAAYLALTQHLATSLVTADEALHEKVGDPGRTLLLADLGTKWKLP